MALSHKGFLGSKLKGMELPVGVFATASSSFLYLDMTVTPTYRCEFERCADRVLGGRRIWRHGPNNLLANIPTDGSVQLYTGHTSYQGVVC